MAESGKPIRSQNAPARRVAAVTLVAGVAIMLLKLAVFYLTGSAAVFTDALESIINIVAAAMMLYSLWLSSRPADIDHPYGHGKIEFLTLGFEGAMVLTAGAVIGYVGMKGLFHPLPLNELDLGSLLLLGVNILSAVLAGWVYWSGKRYGSPVLIADAKHLFTDVFSTLGVIVALVLIRITGQPIIDPIVALFLSGVILFTSFRLLRLSADGLMDRSDPRDIGLVQGILDAEVKSGAIRGYHKVRMRHQGPFHWVDLHIQVDGAMTVSASHELASRIEHRIEESLGQGKATAHVEPDVPVQAAT